MEFVIRVAGNNILIRSVYESIRNRCREYLSESDAAADIKITTNENMIVAEQKGIQRLDRPIDGLMAAETLLVHRLMAEALLDYDTLLMHGAVVAIGGASYLFAGHSGTGKTTHIKKWLENAEGVSSSVETSRLLSYKTMTCMLAVHRGAEKRTTVQILLFLSVASRLWIEVKIIKLRKYRLSPYFRDYLSKPINPQTPIK